MVAHDARTSIRLLERSQDIGGQEPTGSGRQRLEHRHDHPLPLELEVLHPRTVDHLGDDQRLQRREQAAMARLEGGAPD